VIRFLFSAETTGGRQYSITLEIVPCHTTYLLVPRRFDVDASNIHSSSLNGAVETASCSPLRPLMSTRNRFKNDVVLVSIVACAFRRISYCVCSSDNAIN
jgi:hypothetical protein